MQRVGVCSSFSVICNIHRLISRNLALVQWVGCAAVFLMDRIHHLTSNIHESGIGVMGVQQFFCSNSIHTLLDIYESGIGVTGWVRSSFFFIVLFVCSIHHLTSRNLALV